VGTLKPCFSVSGDSVEVAVIEVYDEAKAREVASVEYPTNPGFDDLLGEPYLEDGDDDGIGDRVRPGTEYEVKARAKFAANEEQDQGQVGNDPRTVLTLVVDTRILTGLGLYSAGVFGVRPNDRLLRLERNDGTTRLDFVHAGREGLFVYEVRPGETGSGMVKILLERRQSR